jgi:hypothetical protein
MKRLESTRRAWLAMQESVLFRPTEPERSLAD